jgi:hypothetical protein
MSPHDHVTLLIRNLLDTPLHLYKTFKLYYTEMNQFVFYVIRPQHTSVTSSRRDRLLDQAKETHVRILLSPAPL